MLLAISDQLFSFCRLKIFVPVTVLSLVVLVPVNYTNDALNLSKATFTNIDKLSISNIPLESQRFGPHLQC